MSPLSIFHNLTWKFSAFYNFSEKIQVLNIKLKYLGQDMTKGTI